MLAEGRFTHPGQGTIEVARVVDRQVAPSVENHTAGSSASDGSDPVAMYPSENHQGSSSPSPETSDTFLHKGPTACPIGGTVGADVGVGLDVPAGTEVADGKLGAAVAVGGVLTGEPAGGGVEQPARRIAAQRTVRESIVVAPQQGGDGTSG